MTKGEMAEKYFLEGYTCAQSVLLSFCDDFGFDKDSALIISAPFGGGMGRLREVCGTVSGMFMVLGLAEGYTNPESRAEKAQLYKDVQYLADKFKEENGSIICRDLLGLRKSERESSVPAERTDEYYKSRPCKKLCRCAADIVDEFLKSKVK